MASEATPLPLAPGKIARNFAQRIAHYAEAPPKGWVSSPSTVAGHGIDLTSTVHPSSPPITSPNVARTLLLVARKNFLVYRGLHNTPRSLAQM